MENNKETLEAMENSQNSPEALSDEQLGAVTGGRAFPPPKSCDVCGSTNIVVRDFGDGFRAWGCGDCGELLQRWSNYPVD